MSESDSDDGFIAWGAKKKGGAASQFARSDPTQTASATEQQGAPALRPPERKIAAAERSHLRAVKTLTKQNQLTRNLALQGIEAADDADKYASVRATGGQTIVSQPKPLLNANMPSQTIYDRAFTYSEFETTTDKESARAFEQAAGALKVRVVKGTAGSPERRADMMIFLAAFNKSADFYQEAGETRRAITMFENLLAFCSEQAITPSGDAVLVEALTKAQRYALKKLIALHSYVGAIEARRRVTVELKDLEDSMVAAGKTVEPLEREEKPVAATAPAAPAPASAPGPAPAPAPVAQKAAAEAVDSGKDAAEAKKKGKKGGKQEVAPQQEPAPAAPSPAQATEASLSFAPAPQEQAAPAASVPAQPAELPPIPELPEEDGTPQTAFKRAVIQAMFYHNFQGITSLLNNATLFNDSVARDAVGLRLEGLGISLPMVCAGGDQNRLLKQYLGTLAAAQRVQEIVHMRDVQGNNSIMHACALNRARALDELLRQLHDSGVSYTPAPTEGDAASLVDIGLPLEAARGYSMPIQNQLRTFLRDPSKYVASKPLSTSVSSVSAPRGSSGPTLYGVPLGSAGAGMPANPAALLAAQAQFAMIAAMFQQAAQLSALAGMRQAGAGGAPPLPQPAAKQGAKGQGQGRGGKANAKSGNPAKSEPSSAAAPKGSWASAASKSSSAPVSSTPAAPATVASTSAKGALFETDAEIAARRSAAAASVSDHASVAAASTTAVIGKGKQGAGAAKSAATTAGKKPDGADATDAAGQKFAGLSLDEDLAKATGSARGARGQGGRGGRTGRRKALFDQFKANEELFGIKATYDESLYTSVLDRSAFTPEEIAAADALARQIDEAEARKAVKGSRVDDEEGQFSAVAQGGRHKSGAGGKR